MFDFDYNEAVDVFKTVDGHEIEIYMDEPSAIDDSDIGAIVNLFAERTSQYGGESDYEYIKDRLMNSDYLVVISLDGFPIASANVVDASKPRYDGVVPIDYYELKGTVKLYPRMQQDYFVIAPEYINKGFSEKIREKISEVTPKSYIIVDSKDKLTRMGLMKSGYVFISEFYSELDNSEVQLWVN